MRSGLTETFLIKKLRMSKLLIILFLAFSAVLQSYSQSIDTTTANLDSIPGRADFVVYFDKNKESKNGYRLNGYVVNIPYETRTELHGKRIRIKGKVEIVKGVKNDSNNPNEPKRAGWESDTKYIAKPSIEIIDK